MLAKVGTGKTKTQARRWWRETSKWATEHDVTLAERLSRANTGRCPSPLDLALHAVICAAPPPTCRSRKSHPETCNKNTFDTASRHFSMAHQWSVALKAQEACTLSHCLSERTLRNPRFKADQIFFQDYFSSSEFIKIAVIISLISL
jgi:hypothetical protein